MVGRCASNRGQAPCVPSSQIEHRIDPPNKVIRRYYPVEIKRVKELALSNLSLPHHGMLPRIAVIIETESRFPHRHNESFATQSPNQRTLSQAVETTESCQEQSYGASAREATPESLADDMIAPSRRRNQSRRPLAEDVTRVDYLSEPLLCLLTRLPMCAPSGCCP
jgi:hypothetical protein